jgi:hypothetical protein
MKFEFAIIVLLLISYFSPTQTIEQLKLELRKTVGTLR